MNTRNSDVSDAAAPPPSGLIRYWAAAREAAGTHEEPYRAADLATALADAVAAHGSALATVFARCAFVVDGAPVGRRAHALVALADGGVVEVLPPFAGGAHRAGRAAGIMR